MFGDLRQGSNTGFKFHGKESLYACCWTTGKPACQRKYPVSSFRHSLQKPKDSAHAQNTWMRPKEASLPVGNAEPASRRVFARLTMTCRMFIRYFDVQTLLCWQHPSSFMGLRPSLRPLLTAPRPSGPENMCMGFQTLAGSGGEALYYPWAQQREPISLMVSTSPQSTSLTRLARVLTGSYFQPDRRVWDIAKHPTALEDAKEKARTLVTPFLDRKKVLFVCNENACRSQMASAFAQLHAGNRIEAVSAGSSPVKEINPLMVEVMGESILIWPFANPKPFQPLRVMENRT